MSKRSMFDHPSDDGLDALLASLDGDTEQGESRDTNGHDAEQSTREIVSGEPIEPPAVLGHGSNVVPFVRESASLKVLAEGVARKLVTLADDALDAGALDVDDVPRFLPHAIRLLEREDKREAGERDSRVNLPVVHITIGAGGSMNARVVDAPDLDPVEVVSPIEGGEASPGVESAGEGGRSLDFLRMLPVRGRSE